MDRPVVRRYWERSRVFFVPSGESMAEQSHAQAVDINNIVRRFVRTGELPPARPQVYQDVTALQVPLRDRIEFSERVIADAEAFAQSYTATVPSPSPEPVATPAPSPSPGE